jgi:hypothetical protein
MSGIPLNCGSIENRKAKRELKLFDEVHLLKEELERMDYNAMNGATDKQLKKDITKVYNRLHSIIEE